jgi:cysteine-rich repeat protein
MGSRWAALGALMALFGCGDGSTAGTDASAPIEDAGSSGDSATPSCGDGVVDEGEACDDGNDDRFDGCLEDCTEWIIPDEPPIEALPLEWEFVEIEGARCLNGDPAGFGVSLNPSSERVVIYFEGGGACFNAQCDLLSFSIPFVPPGDGIFNRDNDDNPVRTWNMIYVPYCTGDVYIGDRPDATIEGLAGTRQFVGYRNVGLFLERLVPTFKTSTQVLLTGISAGGFGAAANFERVQRAFGPIPVTLLDDSGPPMPSDALSSCLQASWRETWNLDDTVLRDCGADCADPDDFVFDLARHLIRRFPDRHGGLFSNRSDTVIRSFYGFGENDCDPGLVPSLPAADFQAGLDSFRELAEEEGGFGTYYVNGIGHTCLRGPCFYTTSVEGTRLVDWVAELLEGTTSHVGP